MRELIKTLFAFANRYERQLSGAGMVGGFAFDDVTFRRIDLPNTQAIFIGYLVLAAAAILLLHLFMRRQADGKAIPRWHGMLPMAAQFALGGLWSAFLVFYSRGAVLSEAWPFLLVLAAILIANEVFKKYLDRLILTAIMYFFALFSYAILTVPILTHTIGRFTFLLSGGIAVGAFALFLWLVASIGRPQWRAARWPVLAGSAAVFAVLNAFYFTGILPPLPLALADEGIYHHVVKQDDSYTAEAEPAPWFAGRFFPATVHVKPGEPLYFYSAVFAPIALSTDIVHDWQRYDPKAKVWRSVSRVVYPIHGGRDGGYRGYTVKHAPAAGLWRVDVDTTDGHIIGRLKFHVEDTGQPVPLAVKTLN